MRIEFRFLRVLVYVQHNTGKCTCMSTCIYECVYICEYICMYVYTIYKHVCMCTYTMKSLNYYILEAKLVFLYMCRKSLGFVKMSAMLSNVELIEYKCSYLYIVLVHQPINSENEIWQERILYMYMYSIHVQNLGYVMCVYCT